MNCPITKADILGAEGIPRPNLGHLKGETTRKTTSRLILNELDNLKECSNKVET